MDVRVLPSALQGNVTIPPSKSVTHRAIITASLAEGKSIIHNVDLSSDIRATMEACKSLGCTIEVKDGHPYHTLIIHGGMRMADSANINCAESGSTLRFFIPIACTLEGKKVFIGSGRLPQRPIDAYYEIFDNQDIAYSKPEDKNLPLEVSGTLAGGDYVIDGSISSQYITGLLFALPLLETDSTVTITGKFESKGYVDLTVSILRQFGIKIVCKKDSYYVNGGQSYKPQAYTVEGDASQAAFFLVGGAISGDICIRGFHRDLLQPDRIIVDLLKQMGADIVNSETQLCIKHSNLRGINIDVSQCPDLVPPLAIAAAFAEGTTHITGAARLRIKESDRLQSVSDNLNQLGIEVQELSDGLTIHGGKMHTGQVNSYNDHRITMAFSVAAACVPEGILIKDAQCINKSYPRFFEDLNSLGGKML